MVFDSVTFIRMYADTHGTDVMNYAYNERGGRNPRRLPLLLHVDKNLPSPADQSGIVVGCCVPSY